MSIIDQQISWKDWVYATRPRTFTLSLVPVLVGTALAMHAINSINLFITLCALLFAILIQIGTHFVNDAYDSKGGVDNSVRLGPKRITNTGLIPTQKVLGLGFLAFTIAALIGVNLIVYGGAPMVAVIIASILTGYCYTGGPFPLSYTGAADFMVIIFYGWVAIGSVFYLQTGMLSNDVFVAGVQIGLLATLVLAIQNYRDMISDAKGNKKSLAVRFGKTFARIEVTLMCFVPLLFSAWWFSQGMLFAGLLTLITIPNAYIITREIWTLDPTPECTALFPKSILFHLIFGLTLSLGILLS